MPSDKITLNLHQKERHQLSFMLHLRGWCVKHIFITFSAIYPKGVKVFVPRTSPHRWSSPKTIYTTSVSRGAVWSPKQPQFWCRCGTLVHGQVSHQVRGTWLSSYSSSCYSGHARRPRVKSQIHHDYLRLPRLGWALSRPQSVLKEKTFSNPGCAQAQHQAPSSGWTQRMKIPWWIHCFHPHFLIENHVCL